MKYRARTRGAATVNQQIRHSVGDSKKGAANHEADVRTVQGQLNIHLVQDHRSDRWLEAGGRMNSETLRAIDDFQRRHGLARGGLIEPGDKTARALFRYSGPHRMRVSHGFVALMEKIEGFCAGPCNDSADPPNATIGFGHELHPGPVTHDDRKRWGVISRARAEQPLRQDVRTFEDDVNSDVRVPLNENQFDALVSFSFNIGDGALRSSTLLRLLNEGDYSGAARQFERFYYAHGNSIRGLANRRHAEKALFLRR